MGYGDAYVYALIVSPDTVTEIKRIRSEIVKKRQEIESIVKACRKDKIADPERREHGLRLIDEKRYLFRDLRKACASPIAMYHVATDDWLGAWEACSNYNYRPVRVKTFLKGVNGKLWHGEDLSEKHGDAWCICLPSHYDTDDEFLEDLNVEYVRIPEGCGEYRTIQDTTKFVKVVKE